MTPWWWAPLMLLAALSTISGTLVGVCWGIFLLANSAWMLGLLALAAGIGWLFGCFYVWDRFDRWVLDRMHRRRYSPADQARWERMAAGKEWRL